MFIPELSLEEPELNVHAVCSCCYCRDAIYPDDEIVTMDGDVYHHDCFMDNAAERLLDMGWAVASFAQAYE